jgi:hypothetical protein
VSTRVETGEAWLLGCASAPLTNLIIHHVLEALVEGGSEEDLGLELATGVAVIHYYRL